MHGCLQALYSSKKWQGQWELFLLVREWPQIVGDPLGKVTRPAYFRHDVLWVFVENSAWMQHVQLLKPSILEQVNQALPQRQIADLRWLLQSVVAQSPELTDPVRVPEELDPRRQTQIKEMTSTVDDTECRDALYRLWEFFEKNK